jgi:hypothetical protein
MPKNNNGNFLEVNDKVNQKVLLHAVHILFIR